MKQGWEIKTLGQLADVKGGKRVPKGYRLETKPTDYPYIRVTDFNDSGSVDLNDLHYINKDVYEQIRNYTITTNDLYISIAGTIGKTGIIPEELDGANLTENACKLVFKVDVNPKLVYYFTKTESFLKQAGLNTRVAAMPKLALTRLSTISLLFPKSLPEQQRIVAILDEAFAAIAKAKANAEQNLRNAKELFESYLQSVFENKGEGWEEKKLGEVCSLITKGSSPKWQGIKYVEEPGILFVTSENVGEGKLILEQRKYVEEKFNQKDKKSILQKGDVLTNIVGASIGRTAIYTIEDVANINQAVCILRCKLELISNAYLMNLLNSPFLKEILHSNEVNTARANLSLGFFNNLSIPLPPLKEQQTIVQKLDVLLAETKKLETIYQQKINDLEELKKSILQKAFSGELRTSKEVAA